MLEEEQFYYQVFKDLCIQISYQHKPVMMLKDISLKPASSSAILSWQTSAFIRQLGTLAIVDQNTILEVPCNPSFAGFLLCFSP